MNDIANLCHKEGVRLDATRLAALHRRSAHSDRQRALETLIRDLQSWLDATASAAHEGDHDGLGHGAVRLAATARRLGLTSVARVAADLECCSRRRDAVAMAAVHARLQRLATRSIYAVDPQ